MASRMMALAVRNTSKAPLSVVATRASSSNAHAEMLAKIGNRDVVGFGWNGEPIYADRVDYPMPAIRFKENTPDVLVSFLICCFILDWLTILIFLGFERKGEGFLEETLNCWKKSPLPCIVLSDFRRNEIPNRWMETTHWRCSDRRLFGHLCFVVDGNVWWV